MLLHAQLLSGRAPGTSLLARRRPARSVAASCFDSSSADPVLLLTDRRDASLHAVLTSLTDAVGGLNDLLVTVRRGDGVGAVGWSQFANRQTQQLFVEGGALWLLGPAPCVFCSSHLATPSERD